MKRRSTGFSKEVLALIDARSSGQCEILATGCTLLGEQYHHRRPRGAGGTRRPDTNEASNGLLCCTRCHLRIESARTWALAHGFLLTQSSHPTSEPVWWRCSQTVLLDDGGNLIQNDSEDT